MQLIQFYLKNTVEFSRCGRQESPPSPDGCIRTVRENHILANIWQIDLQKISMSRSTNKKRGINKLGIWQLSFLYQRSILELILYE